MRKHPDITELNRIYSEAEQVDSELFSEQRSNLLLVAGDHYTKKNSKFWSRIRDSEDLTSEQKLRITKNHVQRITKLIVNQIVSHSPGVAIKPHNDSELSDQKAAELHSAVWQDIKWRHRMKEKVRQWAEDYVHLGECFVKVFWDPSAGKLVGYEPEVDPETGMPIVDPMTMQPVQSNRPVFSGDLVFERIHAFNLMRSPEAKSFAESPVLIYRKMVDIEDLKAMVQEPEKQKLIEADNHDTFTVFDANSSSYKQVKNQTMVREYYYRPGPQFPNGYYFIATAHGILFEGELPLGHFPIKHVGFDEIPTSPRSRSIIKVLRPYQAEINRASSQMATHQVTLGSDKLLIQDGSKLVHGGTLPGIRAIKYSGAKPEILAGRTGDQYLNYITQTIQEMYQAANLDYEEAEITGQMDAYTLLFRSMRQKKKFSIHGEKFELFLIDIAYSALTLSKAYMRPDAIVRAVGRREFINIAEFKSSDDLGYQIMIEPAGEDIESKLGRALTMQQVLQYVGQSLGKEDIGRMIRSMPYMNTEEAYTDLTLDYDNARNDVLALDRGEYRPANILDNHEYLIKRLIHRMKQADFQQLPDAIKMLYERKKQEHEEALADQKRKILAAQADLIPSGGYLVTCDLYLTDPKDPTKTRRARIPYESLTWLIKRLEDQGAALEPLAAMPGSAQMGIAEAFAAKNSTPQTNNQMSMPGPGMPSTPPDKGQMYMNQQAARSGS